MNEKRRMMWASLVLGVLALLSQAHADELDDLLDLGDDTEQTKAAQSSRLMAMRQPLKVANRDEKRLPKRATPLRSNPLKPKA